MKLKMNMLVFAVSALILPNIVAAETQRQLTVPLFTSPEGKQSVNLTYRRGGPHRAAPVRRPVRVTPHRARAYVRPRARQMRRYVAGAALVAGARCYVDRSGYGQVSGKRCCISGKCYSGFYVD